MKIQLGLRQLFTKKADYNLFADKSSSRVSEISHNIYLDIKEDGAEMPVSCGYRWTVCLNFDTYFHYFHYCSTSEHILGNSSSILYIRSSFCVFNKGRKHHILPGACCRSFEKWIKTQYNVTFNLVEPRLLFLTGLC